MTDLQSGLVSLTGDRTSNHRVIELYDLITLVADQELADMFLIRETASNISPERLDFMDESVFQQKIKHPIDCRGLSIDFFITQGFQQFISQYRLVAVPDQFKDTFTKVRKTDIVFNTDGLRFLQCPLDTGIMVMFDTEETRRVGCSHGFNSKDTEDTGNLIW